MNLEFRIPILTVKLIHFFCSSIPSYISLTSSEFLLSGWGRFSRACSIVVGTWQSKLLQTTAVPLASWGIFTPSSLLGLNLLIELLKSAATRIPMPLVPSRHSCSSDPARLLLQLGIAVEGPSSHHSGVL